VSIFACGLLTFALLKTIKKARQENSNLKEIFENTLAELEKIPRHIRNSRFEQATEGLLAFKCAVPTSRIKRSKYIAQLQKYVQEHNAENKM